MLKFKIIQKINYYTPCLVEILKIYKNSTIDLDFGIKKLKMVKSFKCKCNNNNNNNNNSNNNSNNNNRCYFNNYSINK